MVAAVVVGSLKIQIQSLKTTLRHPASDQPARQIAHSAAPDGA
jgi:hypothetical protein